MPHETKCRSCGAAIVWLTTAKGKSMPVDAASVDREDMLYESTKHVSHFATCPHARDWRSTKKGSPPG